MTAAPFDRLNSPPNCAGGRILIPGGLLARIPKHDLRSAYGHLAQVGTLLAKIYLAGDASELNPAAARNRGRTDNHIYGARR
jgi:hypothetical protein